MTCARCNASTEEILTFAEYDCLEKKEVALPCEACGGPKELAETFTEIDVIYRDGMSGGWASKAGKENNYRQKRYSYLGTRARNNHKVSKLIPNFQGEIAESWKEAKEMAYEKVSEAVGGGLEGAKMGQHVADTFTPRVEAEVSK